MGLGLGRLAGPWWGRKGPVGQGQGGRTQFGGCWWQVVSDTAEDSAHEEKVACGLGAEVKRAVDLCTSQNGERPSRHSPHRDSAHILTLLLLDNSTPTSASLPQGGSGQALDWRNLQVPTHEARQGWLLAGGLSPDNVATAAGLARPTAVDVSSGVCGPDGG